MSSNNPFLRRIRENPKTSGGIVIAVVVVLFIIIGLIFLTLWLTGIFPKKSAAKPAEKPATIITTTPVPTTTPSPLIARLETGGGVPQATPSTNVSVSGETTEAPGPAPTVPAPTAPPIREDIPIPSPIVNKATTLETYDKVRLAVGGNCLYNNPTYSDEFIEPCSPEYNDQYFKFIKRGTNYAIQNDLTKKCLTSDNAKLSFEDCRYDQSQQYAVSTPLSDKSFYFIKNILNQQNVTYSSLDKMLYLEDPENTKSGQKFKLSEVSTPTSVYRPDYECEDSIRSPVEEYFLSYDMSCPFGFSDLGILRLQVRRNQLNGDAVKYFQRSSAPDDPKLNDPAYIWIQAKLCKGKLTNCNSKKLYGFISKRDPEPANVSTVRMMIDMYRALRDSTLPFDIPKVDNKPINVYGEKLNADNKTLATDNWVFIEVKMVPAAQSTIVFDDSDTVRKPLLRVLALNEPSLAKIPTSIAKINNTLAITPSFKKRQNAVSTATGLDPTLMTFNYAGYIQTTPGGDCGEASGKACPGEQCCGKNNKCGGTTGDGSSEFCQVDYAGGIYNAKPSILLKNWSGIPFTVDDKCGPTNNRACHSYKCCNATGDCVGSTGDAACVAATNARNDGGKYNNVAPIIDYNLVPTFGVLDIQPALGSQSSCPEGWNQIYDDTNKGCGGGSEYTRICVKTGTSTLGLTDLRVEGTASCPLGYNLYGVNLKHKTGYQAYFCKKFGIGPFINDIKIIEGANPQLPSGYSTVANVGGWTNVGCSGSPKWMAYKK